MEQVNRYAGRAAALALACFVVAFSVSVPAAAASSLIGEAYCSIRQGGVGPFTYPYNIDALNEGQDPCSWSGRYTNTASYDCLGFYTFRLKGGTTYRVTYSSYWTCTNFTALNRFVDRPYVYMGSNFQSVPLNSYSREFYNYKSTGNKITFTVSESVNFTVPGIEDVYYPIELTGSLFSVSGVTSNSEAVVTLMRFDIVELSSEDTNAGKLDKIEDQLGDITIPTPEDNQQADRVDGAVSDKTQQSNQITNQIEQLQKPNVDSSSGKPVVGGMVVDPMQQVDRDSFNAYTNVLGTIFGSSTILGYFIIVFSLIFISYVIFGKSGG